MRISTGNFDSISFLEVTPLLNLEIWPKWKILLKQFVSVTPLKPLNRISWNLVVMKDIMCRFAFLQEMLIWSFWGAIYIPFFDTNAWNCHSLYTAFSSNVGAWGMLACSLFLSLSYETTTSLIFWMCDLDSFESSKKMFVIFFYCGNKRSQFECLDKQCAMQSRF